MNSEELIRVVRISSRGAANSGGGNKNIRSTKEFNLSPEKNRKFHINGRLAKVVLF